MANLQDGDGQELAKRITLSVRCSDLPITQQRIDPLCALFVRDPESGEYEYVGQTERVRADYSPVFQGQFVMFHYSGPFHELKFCIFNADTDQNLALIANKDLLGSAIISLEDCVGDPDQPLRLQCKLATEEGADVFGGPEGNRNSLIMFSALSEEEEVPGQFAAEADAAAQQEMEGGGDDGMGAAGGGQGGFGGDGGEGMGSGMGGGMGGEEYTDSDDEFDEEETSPEEIALARMDVIVDQLRQEGKILESLECMERGLILRRNYYGVESEEVFQASKDVAEMCNFLGMTYLQQEEYDVALELFKKAEILTARHRLVRAVTYNNMGCYYRKRGNLKRSLSYVEKALKIESKHVQYGAGGSDPMLKSADTHLNMCTILSELKRHDKAIAHAKIALRLLRQEIFGRKNKNDLNLVDALTGQAAMSTEKPPVSKARIAVLGIAYHNLAVQQEFLRKAPECLASYEKGMAVVNKHLGHDHPLYKSLKESMKAAKKNFGPAARSLPSYKPRHRPGANYKGNVSNLIDERKQQAHKNDMPFFPMVNSLPAAADADDAENEAAMAAAQAEHENAAAQDGDDY